MASREAESTAPSAPYSGCNRYRAMNGGLRVEPCGLWASSCAAGDDVECVRGQTIESCPIGYHCAHDVVDPVKARFDWRS